MRSTGRTKRPGDVDEHDLPEPYRQDSLPGYWAPVLPPAAAAPAIGAVLQEVIHVDLTRSLAAGDMGLSAAGSSAAKGKPGGGGSGGGSTDGTVTSYTSGATGGYNVTIDFKGTWTAALQNVFKASAERISAIIVGDVPDVRVKGGVIDDIRISAELKAIDGTGGILGQAGPTSLRTGSYLPATAIMEFDVADADAYQAAGLFDEIVTHEMLHSIGYGSIWSYKGLVSGSSFIGGNAMSEYDKLVDAFQGFDNGVNALAVPLETGGGAGTVGSHWSEAVFRNELMTGWLDSASPAPGMIAAPLSMLTVASMKDLGYVVSGAPPVDAYFLT